MVAGGSLIDTLAGSAFSCGQRPRSRSGYAMWAAWRGWRHGSSCPIMAKERSLPDPQPSPYRGTDISVAEAARRLGCSPGVARKLAPGNSKTSTGTM